MSPANPHVAIREATPNDMAAVLRLYDAAGITGDDAFSVAEASEQLKQFARYPFYRVFVATIDDEVVGTYEFLLMDNLAKRGSKSAIVEDVAVSPAAQGSGVGRAMMLHARDLARAHGAYKLALSSNLNRKAAHSFYLALNFEQHGLSFLTTL